jgi:hypothetical protein
VAADTQRNRTDGIEPSFRADEGLLVYVPVKVALQRMLDDGVFDDATSIVLAYSDSKHIDSRQHGTFWECHALAALLSSRATAKFEGS